MTRFCSFYPVFPVPLDLSHEVNLDVTHSGGLKLGGDEDDSDFAPDVLIVPSRLKHFTKVCHFPLVANWCDGTL